MNRDEILAEIERLEREKAANPMLLVGINAQITALCDRLKSKPFEPRKVT